MSVVSLQAVAKMVQECYKYVDAFSDLTIKLRLIDTLRTVTAGKVSSPAISNLKMILICNRDTHAPVIQITADLSDAVGLIHCLMPLLCVIP